MPESMRQLNIIRASAGSGKTQRLAGFFLDIVLRENLDYFKSILAVTFTNKATEEMKHRIVEQLYKLSVGQGKGFSEITLSHFKGDQERAKGKASVLLRKILHEYSWFSIETIDTFFQRVIRAFTRELGIPGNYSVEIDTQPVLQYAVDQLLDTLGDSKDLLSWLQQFSEHKMDEGKSWDIHSDLLELGNEIFKEEFAAGSSALHNALADREKLMGYRDKLYGIKTNFENRCRDYGKKGLESISEAGLSEGDFYKKSTGPAKLFEKLEQAEVKNSKGELISRSSLTVKLLEDSANWPSSDTKQKDEVTELAANTLLPLLAEIADFVENNSRTYFTAEVIRKNLYAVGILVDLEEKIRQYRLEKNAFILSDAPRLLDRIINNNDTPFIYEKMGNRYGHFLIDEFQDTSRMQWGNFKPLISNSISQAKDCLIVGDVKQSIYRWRNGDWNILASDIYNEYPKDVIRSENLDTNWRSAGNVVKFNNRLFPATEEKIRSQLQNFFKDQGSNTKNYLEILHEIYSNISQEVSGDKKDNGNILIRFFSKQLARENIDYYVEPFIEAINSLLENGYLPGDIALLVRTKKEGKKLADLLINLNNESRFINPVEVISDESLFLSASHAVNLLIAAMQYLDAPDENIYRAKLAGLYNAYQTAQVAPGEIFEMKIDAGFFNSEKTDDTFPDDFIRSRDTLISLPLYEMTEQLVRIFSVYRFKADVPYVHALLDLVYAYSQNNPPDCRGFLEYWQEEGSTKSIPAADSQNAIRILTIHKAKGLEFKAVFIPFCSWDLGQKPNSVFWVRSEKPPFDFLPLVPLNFTQTLKDTYFAEEYYSELFKSYVDNLNLLYVAFTRAVDTLIAFPLFNDNRKSDSQISTTGDLLYECLAGSESGIDGQFDPKNLTFTSGLLQPVISPTKQKSAISRVIYSYAARPATGRMFFNANGFNYFQDETKVRDRRIRGKVLHDLLSEIITLDDLDKTIRETVLEGLISEEEGKTLVDHISFGMTNDTVKSWFDGSGKVLTERDIIIPGGQVKRPDRVVVWEKETHIIDYKFSRGPEERSYRKQVKDYMYLIAEITGKSVKGFLWYVDNNELIEIERQ